MKGSKLKTILFLLIAIISAPIAIYFMENN